MKAWRREEAEEEMTAEDMTVVSKETLTIKVDMSQSVHGSRWSTYLRFSPRLGVRGESSLFCF